MKHGIKNACKCRQKGLNGKEKQQHKSLIKCQNFIQKVTTDFGMKLEAKHSAKFICN